MQKKRTERKAIKPAARRGRASLRWRKGPWLAAGVLVVVGAASAIWSLQGRGPRLDQNAIVAPPDPDTSRFEALVARKIGERRRAVEADPRSAEKWGKLGMAFDIHNLVDEAVVCYAQAERLDPSDFRWPYMRALCMPEQDPADVVAVLRRAQSLRPHYPAVNLRLGQELLRLGRTDAARPYFERALVADPANSHALLGLAKVDFARKDFTTSRSRLERAVRLRPDHGEAYRLLARVYRALALPDRARDALKTAARLPSKTPILDPARTEVLFEGATVELLVHQASRLRKDGKFAQAIRKLRKALDERPDNADAHLQLGLALFFDLGRRDEGLPELREALRLAPSHPHARRALEAALQQMKTTERIP